MNGKKQRVSYCLEYNKPLEIDEDKKLIPQGLITNAKVYLLKKKIFKKNKIEKIENGLVKNLIDNKENKHIPMSTLEIPLNSCLFDRKKTTKKSHKFMNIKFSYLTPYQKIMRKKQDNRQKCLSKIPNNSLNFCLNQEKLSDQISTELERKQKKGNLTCIHKTGSLFKYPGPETNSRNGARRFNTNKDQIKGSIGHNSLLLNYMDNIRNRPKDWESQSYYLSIMTKSSQSYELDSNQPVTPACKPQTNDKGNKFESNLVLPAINERLSPLSRKDQSGTTARRKIKISSVKMTSVSKS